MKSERLQVARPILMSSTLNFCKLSFRKLYAKARKLQIAQWNDALDYADFIHGLWQAMLTHPELTEESKKLLEILGDGDAIELLNETVMEHRKTRLLEG